jgi:ribosomal subunit interface protein
MQSPLRLTFRHVDRSPALEAQVRELVSRLQRFHERITACHVVIAAPHVHPGKGSPFEVGIELTLPGGLIHARSTHGSNSGHTDVYAALHQAFASAKRQLLDFEPVHC